MAFLADDDVVVHRDAERLGDIDDRLRHLDVGAAAWGRHWDGVHDMFLTTIILTSRRNTAPMWRVGAAIGGGYRACS